MTSRAASTKKACYKVQTFYINQDKSKKSSDKTGALETPTSYRLGYLIFSINKPDVFFAVINEHGLL